MSHHEEHHKTANSSQNEEHHSSFTDPMGQASNTPGSNTGLTGHENYLGGSNAAPGSGYSEPGSYKAADTYATPTGQDNSTAADYTGSGGPTHGSYAPTSGTGPYSQQQDSTIPSSGYTDRATHVPGQGGTHGVRSSGYDGDTGLGGNAYKHGTGSDYGTSKPNVHGSHGGSGSGAGLNNATLGSTIPSAGQDQDADYGRGPAYGGSGVESQGHQYGHHQPGSGSYTPTDNAGLGHTSGGHPGAGSHSYTGGSSVPSSGHTHNPSGVGSGSTGHAKDPSDYTHDASGVGSGSSGYAHNPSGIASGSTGYNKDPSAYTHDASGVGSGSSGYAHNPSGAGSGSSGHTHNTSGIGSGSSGYAHHPPGTGSGSTGYTKDPSAYTQEASGVGSGSSGYAQNPSGTASGGTGYTQGTSGVGAAETSPHTGHGVTGTGVTPHSGYGNDAAGHGYGVNDPQGGYTQGTGGGRGLANDGIASNAGYNGERSAGTGYDNGVRPEVERGSAGDGYHERQRAGPYKADSHTTTFEQSETSASPTDGVTHTQAAASSQRYSSAEAMANMNLGQKMASMIPGTQANKQKNAALQE